MRATQRVIETASLEDHAAAIRDQVNASLEDPETRRLAVAVASGSYEWVPDPRTGTPVPVIQFHGRYYRVGPGATAPPICNARDYSCEIVQVWNFICTNVRYTGDHDGYDTYQDLRTTLESGGGDCLPQGTQLLLRSGRFVAIEDVNVGDEIYDGTGWTKVTNWWDKGILPTRRLRLNNGCILTCTDDHRLFKVPRCRGGKWGTANLPGIAEDAVELLAAEVDVKDDLLQPTTPLPEGVESLSESDAVILGAYIAEGWVDKTRVGIAGIPNSKGLRERVIIAAKNAGISVCEAPRYVTLTGERIRALVAGCGRRGPEKRLPHTNFTRETAATLVSAMEQGDGGYSQSGSMVYSTTSELLALQYRVLQRMLGRSTHITRVDKHGGFGSKPIFRVTVRKPHSTDGQSRRPWAKVRSIEEGLSVPCYDIETTSHRIYLPESDVITHNCDDYTIAFCALLRTLGYQCAARVISLDGKAWAHVYPLVGHPKQPYWIPLDATEEGRSLGWEYPRPVAIQDFIMD